jgi:hypothetical protein
MAAIAVPAAQARDPSPKFAAEITARLKLIDGTAPRRPFIKHPSFRNLQDEIDQAVNVSDMVNRRRGRAGAVRN